MQNLWRCRCRRVVDLKLPIVAGRRFWRFLLVNQLPLSIMAVHAQYRATVIQIHAL